MFLRASLYLDNARLSSGNVQQIFSHSKCFILSFQVCKESWPWDHLISRVQYYKKGWYSWVTLHLSSLPQRWNIKTILFRQFFRDWDWRASMGCFTGISFTTLQPPPRHRAQFILNLFWGRWVSLERYLRTYKWCLNTTKAVYCCGPFNWLTISIWTKENLCPSIGKMMPCQLELKAEWDVQSMSDRTDRIRSGTNRWSFYQDRLKT